MFIEFALEFFECAFVLGFAAEDFVDDFHGGAHLVEGCEFEHFGALDGEDAFVGVFFEECFENSTGLFPVFGEIVAFLDIVCPFAAGERRGVVGNVADEVEVAVVFTNFFGEFGEFDAVLLKLFNDGFFLLTGVPMVDEVIERVVLVADVFTTVV